MNHSRWCSAFHSGILKCPDSLHTLVIDSSSGCPTRRPATLSKIYKSSFNYKRPSPLGCFFPTNWISPIAFSGQCYPFCYRDGRRIGPRSLLFLLSPHTRMLVQKHPYILYQGKSVWRAPRTCFLYALSIPYSTSIRLSAATSSAHHLASSTG